MRVVRALSILFALGVCGGAAAQPSSGMARVPEPVLFYETVGQGAPVVLLHGGQMDRRMWNPQFGLFGKSFRVVRYDVRNYGRSATATVPYSDVDDLLALLDELKIGRSSS